MRRIGALLIGVAVLMLLLPSAALAQDDPTIIFGIYYRCNQAQEARADEIVQQAMGPIVQEQVDAGNLTGWLWLTHNQGGAWRRIMATLGTDIGTMMDARDAIVESFGSSEEAAELTGICSSHDDYIWMGIANSTAGSDAGAVGGATLSAYHACDMSREARADEIFTDVLAPLYEKHREAGELASWGYYSHRVGGIFRRLETISGADHKTLLGVQNAVYQEAGQSNPLEMQEFRQICSWHSDYMWDNATSE